MMHKVSCDNKDMKRFLTKRYYPDNMSTFLNVSILLCTNLRVFKIIITYLHIDTH